MMKYKGKDIHFCKSAFHDSNKSLIFMSKTKMKILYHLLKISLFTCREPEKGVHVLQCNYCCCKIGLWNYSQAIVARNNTTIDEPLSKKPKLVCTWHQVASYIHSISYSTCSFI